MLCGPQPYRVIKERRVSSPPRRSGESPFLVFAQPRLGIFPQPIPEIVQLFFNFRFYSVEVSPVNFSLFGWRRAKR